MRLTLLALTGHASFQGQPTVGLRHLGVPPGGPFDTLSSRLANALLGNDAWATVIELASANFEGLCEQPGWLAMTGGGHKCEVDGVQVALQSRFWVKAGAHLLVKPASGGFRAYLAAPGGWSASLVPGVSALIKPRATLTGCGQMSTSRPRILQGPPETLRPSPLGTVGLRDGRTLTATATVRLDRRGLRLVCAAAGPGRADELSRPVAPGSVQATPDGELLLHGPDGPTIGGYELVGVVARACQDRLGQVVPGDEVILEPWPVAEALERLEDQRRRLTEQLARLKE